MLRKRKGGLITGRLSFTILRWREMVGLILVFFLNGISCYLFVKDVKYPPLISAWEGSCALLKCEYVMRYSNSKLSNLTWYKDPLYSDSERKWTGTIVYTNKEDQKEVAEAFRGRVQFLGNLEKDCTLLIQSLQVNDSGDYSVRMERGEDKWMTAPYLNLNVSVSPPEPKIDVPSMIRESQETKVTCSIDHSCHEKYPIQLHWDGPVNGRNATYYEETTSALGTRNTLTFVPSWEHDKKPLRCHLSSKNDSTKTSESEIKLEVEYSPKLVKVDIEGLSPILKEGDTIILHCLVHSSNPPVMVYRWYKNNAEQSQQKNSAMEITDVSAKDAGNYSCEATNSVGAQKSQPLDIVVRFAPKEVQVKKNVTENIIEGTYVALTCIAKCNPPATGYSWYKDDHRLSKAEKDLKFQQICADESGDYRCEVYCPMGNASSPSEYLNVMYAPKKVAISIHSPNPGLIKEGDTVTLVCTYNSSNPEDSTFLWYLNKIKLEPITYEMTIPQITPTEAGQYSCEAKNEAGLSPSPAVLVDVKYAPKNVKVQVPAPSTLQEDRFAELECNVEQSNPIVSRYKWFKDDHIYADHQDSKLIFPELKSSDSGSYTCEAMNDIYVSRSEAVQVKVRYSPRNVVVSVDPSTWIIEDSNISLICYCEAEPEADRHTWYKMGKFLTTTISQRLTFTRIKKDQSGQYQCEATNSIASTKSEIITLGVRYSSKTIVKFVAIPAGLVIFLLLIVVVLRFRVWKNLKRPKLSTGGESDDRSDTFFVLNRKQNQDDPQDELRNTSAPPDPEYQESINYSVIQFPSNHRKEETSVTGARINSRNSVTLKNSEGATIYSFLQKPSKPPQQSRDDFQDGRKNTAVSPDPDFEESINYSVFQFPPNHTREEAALTRPCTNNRSSVTLKSNEASAIYSVVQKPCMLLQAKEPSIDYENVSDKTEEDIDYSTLVNLKCKPTNEYEWDSESDFEDIGVQYAELRH